LTGSCLPLIVNLKILSAKIFFEVTFVAYGLVMLIARSYCSDKLVEQAVGMSSVAEIFQLRSEAFFRDNEVHGFSVEMLLFIY
jgi:hypothetical protein